MLSLFALPALLLFAVSCATVKDDVIDAHDGVYTQAEANKDFSEAYQTYRKNLNLTGAHGYTVVRGDSLSSITEKQYGGKDYMYYFPIIMLASADAHVVDPDLIYPGMKLTVPNLKLNLDDPGIRKNMKDYFGDIADIYKRKEKPAVETELRKVADKL
jgi:LysM repeat protein